MPRKHRQILPFRIPFFRIFYSTTYTAVFIITLIFLAITPGTLLWEAIRNSALQYVFIIGGGYILTALVAIFIYSSRLYTNRTVLAAVGKPYIPIEDGEIVKKVRSLIVAQLERSAIIAWEAKPRDIRGEIAFAQKEGLTTKQETNESVEVNTIGTIVPVEIENPPWGNVQHLGWTPPSDAPAELQSNLQFEVVIAELPNLLEARAVSLAPIVRHREGTSPDPRFVEILRRQEKMGLREYLTQLSYLRLIDLDGEGRELLTRYERARFSGTPISYDDFKDLMLAFGNVMDSMQQVDPAISKEIQAQVHTGLDELQDDTISSQESHTESVDNISPVTARTRITTPYLPQINISNESMSSVLRPSSVRQTPLRQSEAAQSDEASTYDSTPYESDMGSVVHMSVS